MDQVYNLLIGALVWGLGIVAIIFAAVVVASRMARGGKGEFRPPDTGIEFVEGRPGAGKSFKAVGDVITYLERDRRPVYTNLPLKWRVFRTYLRNRGGNELARLLYTLDRDHFVRFCERTDAVAKERDRMTKMRATQLMLADHAERVGNADRAAKLRRRARKLFSDESFQRWIDRRYGPAIFSGADANAIHPTAVIVIDEAHKWFPESEQRGKGEPPCVQKYLTMLRHQMHLLICVTQERMQVSLSFRRLARAFWKVRDRSEDHVVWGLRWGHFGVKALAYCKYTPEAESARGGEASEPSEQFTVFPWSPKHSWRFRIYESFTHAGSRRAQLKARAQARLAAGLTDSGRLVAEERAMEQAEQDKRERRKPHRIARWVSRQCFRVAIVMAIFVVGRATGGGGGSPSTAVVAGPATPVGEQAKPPELKWGKQSGIGPTFVRVDGKRVDLGSTHEAATLVGVDVRGRRSLWLAAGEQWLWNYGDERPSRLGRASDVGREISARREAAGLVRGDAVAAPRTR